MKITVNRKELKAALAGMSYFARSPTLEILRSVRFDAVGEGIQASATNLSEYATYQFKDAFFNCGNNPIIAPISRLKTACGLLDSTRICIEQAKDDDVVRITSGDDMMKCFGCFAKEWPNEAIGTKALLPCDDFIPSFRIVAKAASCDDSRIVINGVLLDAGNAVATDGRRLSMRPLAHGLSKMIVPNSSFLLRAAIAGQVHVGRCVRGKDVEAFILQSDRWTYTVNSVVGAYPHWQQVVPKDFAGHFTLTPETVNKLIRLTSNISVYHDNPVQLEAKDLTLTATFKDKDAKATISIGGSLSAAKYGAEGHFTIALNPAYLNDMLKSGHTTIQFTDMLSPVMAQTDDSIYVLMPVRVK